MSRILTVAAVQLAPVALAPESCVAKLADTLRYIGAAVPSVQLVVFPELFLTGFVGAPGAIPAGFMEKVAEPVPGPLSERLCELAAESGRWLVPGSYMERDGNRLFNTALAISPAGEIVARYRKMFPWMPHEEVTPGDQYVTFDIEGICRVGMSICYDGWVPEIPRALAWMGAQVIVQPTGTYTSDRRQELILAQANAITNQVYLINPNLGQSFGYGHSIVVDPEGRVLAQAGNGEEILTATIDVDLVDTIREHGSLGMSPIWKQLRDFPPPLPFAREGYAAGRIMEGLGPLHG